MNELTTETIRKFDPFYQYGVGSMLLSTQRSARIDNTARYDSPKWSGFSFGLSYSLGENTKHITDGWNKPSIGGGKERGIDNDGYAVNLSYDNGPLMLTGNWSRVADSNDSSVWNLGTAYKFGPARVSLVYEKTKDEGYKGGNNNWSVNLSDFPPTPYGTDSKTNSKSEQDIWLLGLEWNIGPGQLDASVQWGQLDDVKLNGLSYLGDRDIWKYSLGYTYNLSKRTSVYGQVSYTDYDDKDAGYFYTGMERDSVTAFQIGMTHKF